MRLQVSRLVQASRCERGSIQGHAKAQAPGHPTNGQQAGGACGLICMWCVSRFLCKSVHALAPAHVSVILIIGNGF
jgi:hypothetical protein